jgi:predicted amidohydrolase
VRFQVGLAQMAPRLGDVTHNLQRHLALVEEAKAQGVDLLLFPELGLTGYTLKDLVPSVALRPTADDPVFQQLLVASEGMDLVVGFIEESERHVFYNSAAYLSAGRLVHLYRKVYLPTYGLFDEGRFWGSGDRLRAFDTRFGRMALLICRDVWHLSASYLAVMDGADTILAISAAPGWGVEDGQDRLTRAQSWERLIRCLAQFLTCYYFYCNRVGCEDGVPFFGGSLAVAPGGRLLAQAPDLEEVLIIATWDTATLRRVRSQSTFLRDERLDLTLRELQRIAQERLQP